MIVVTSTSSILILSYARLGYFYLIFSILLLTTGMVFSLLLGSPIEYLQCIVLLTTVTAAVIILVGGVYRLSDSLLATYGLWPKLLVLLGLCFLPRAHYMEPCLLLLTCGIL